MFSAASEPTDYASDLRLWPISADRGTDLLCVILAPTPLPRPSFDLTEERVVKRVTTGTATRPKPPLTRTYAFTTPSAASALLTPRSGRRSSGGELRCR